MATRTTTNTHPGEVNRVPYVDTEFWVIKLLAVTVGETAADYMNVQLGLGLSTTSWIIGGLLLGSLLLQFAQRRYVPWIYWITVVLVSVVGTLVTDNLVDNMGVSLVTTTAVFSVLLAATFAVWYGVEKTLSIHEVYTTRRESFYWLAILLTFALGTAAGDLIAESLGLGYFTTGLMFAAVIGAIAVAHFKFGLNAVLAFWLAYILTRPLGASLGDLLSQPAANGGLGFGTTVTSLIFLLAITAVIILMSIKRRKVAAATV